MILAAGIAFTVFGKNGKKKIAATAAVFILTSAMMLPVLHTSVFATDEDLPDGYVTMDKVFRLEDGNPFTPHTTNPVSFCVVGYPCELRNSGRIADIAPLNA